MLKALLLCSGILVASAPAFAAPSCLDFDAALAAGRTAPFNILTAQELLRMDQMAIGEGGPAMLLTWGDPQLNQIGADVTAICGWHPTYAFTDAVAIAYGEEAALTAMGGD